MPCARKAKSRASGAPRSRKTTIERGPATDPARAARACNPAAPIVRPCAILNPDPGPKLENRQPADQLSHPALELIASRPDLFSRQGYLRATFHRRGGKTFGPYYLLCYREEGRLRSVYLGRPGELVEQVRQMLEARHRPITQQRLFEQSDAADSRLAADRKDTGPAPLCPFGLRLKGAEVRGWRTSPLRWLLPCRRHLYRPVAVRMPVARGQIHDPTARLHRFLAARDGYVPDDASLPTMESFYRRQ